MGLPSSVVTAPWLGQQPLPQQKLPSEIVTPDPELELELELELLDELELFDELELELFCEATLSKGQTWWVHSLPQQVCPLVPMLR